jgi:peroxiredoxin Q/BCP
MVVEGEKAPSFTAISDDGKAVLLNNYVGRRVLLYFYPKDGTPGCTTEAKEFRDLADKFDKENVIILGVSKDSIESHRKFKAKHGLPFTLLSDTDGKILTAYGVWKKKSIFGKTSLGIERTSFLIDEKGMIQKIYRKVNPKGHAQSCLIDLSHKNS